MSIVPIKEGPVVLNVVLCCHSSINLVTDTAQDQSSWLDKVLSLTAVNLGRLDQPVVLS